jgi:hypothetical protein
VLVGVDPDVESRRCLPAWPCVDSLPGDDVTGRSGPTHGRTVTGHTRLPRVVKLLIKPAAPVPGRSGSRGRTSPRRTPPGSVIPRVTPTATDRSPDHHRTVGSLTVIPQATTGPNQTALNGMPSQPELPRPYWTGLSGRLAVTISPKQRRIRRRQATDLARWPTVRRESGAWQCLLQPRDEPVRLSDSCPETHQH